jgi:hypothetical protein
LSNNRYWQSIVLKGKLHHVKNIFYVPYSLPDGDVFRIEMADAGQVNQGMVA